MLNAKTKQKILEHHCTFLGGAGTEADFKPLGTVAPAPLATSLMISIAFRSYLCEFA